MEYFRLEHPSDKIVLCDRQNCRKVADYLEIDRQGHELRVCASHTTSEKYVSRLSERSPNLELSFKNRPAA
jgi:hypothetical protein